MEVVEITIYIILERRNGHPSYVTCFITRKEAEQYVYDNPKCFIKHEIRAANGILYTTR